MLVVTPGHRTLLQGSSASLCSSPCHRCSGRVTAACMGRCYSEVCAYYLGRTITGPLTATASPLLTVLVRAGRGTRHQPATSQLSSQDSLVWLHSSSLGTAAHNLFILHAECGVVVHTAQLHPGPHASVQCPCFVAVSCRVAAWATHGAALSTLRCSHKAARSTRKLSQWSSA